MPTEIKNFNSFNRKKADAGLLFVAGLFFLVLAFAVVYFSHFGLAPFQKMNNEKEMSAAAALSLASAPASNDTEIKSKTENEAFLASLSQTPVKEIFIGSYGVADKEILEELRSELEKVYGVQTTLLNPGPAIPKEEPFYNKTRGQYNSDVLQKSIEQSSSAYGQAVRFLYVADVNMSSFSEWSPEAPWLRADKNTNAALLSIHSFRINNSTLGKESARQILLERAKKSAIRALGVTVGFGFSSSAADTSCIMYPALTLKELDAEQSELCSPEKEAVGRVFQE
jgi:predicted Zn-dependent protease